MKRKLAGLSRKYRAALGTHLRRNHRASLPTAQGLGRQALAVGMETLDLARIHEQALIALVLPGSSARNRGAMIRRAGSFFAEVIAPIETTHRSAQEISGQIDRLNHALNQRSEELLSSNHRLRREIAQRKSVEEALRKSEQHYGQLLDQSRNMQEQLRLLSRQLLSAQEEERKKISRELHDVIAQTLTGINIQLATLKDKASLNTKGLERSIARTQRLVVHSVNIVHQFARELRPTVLDDLGLIPALHTFMKGFKEQTGIRVSLSAFAGIQHVNGDTRTVLYRIAQEALTNVARHAQASKAEVRIHKSNGDICMLIKDDGKGFQHDQSLPFKKSKRLGLLGMRERLEMVGGKFSVNSAMGKGTTVLAQIPLMDSTPRDGESDDRAAVADKV